MSSLKTLGLAAFLTAAAAAPATAQQYSIDQPDIVNLARSACDGNNYAMGQLQIAFATAGEQEQQAMIGELSANFFGVRRQPGIVTDGYQTEDRIAFICSNGSDVFDMRSF